MSISPRLFNLLTLTMPYSFNNFDSSAEKIKSRLAEELGALRTSRANSALVKDIQVELYGVKTKLEGLASISIQDAKTLVVQPWDKSSVEAIEKAIRASNLGLQPIADKNILRIVLPELTGERRQALLKLAGDKLEEARIALRRAREDVWKEAQEKERAGDISEDEKFRVKEELQKKVDKANRELDEITDKKRREIQE